MSLATVIRLEFAYPGIGVLAGDSLQYLSIATAHGVIMVFFMIMPSIFGAFGNFLLPTQLGVHDVAFPRLNSAAFWFLPGALIMLCQLICVDRRYQRMNAFNIRQLQSNLKRKFFTDLVTEHSSHTLINQTLIGIRFKNNQTLNSISDSLLSYRFGTTTPSKPKSLSFKNMYGTLYDTFNLPLNMITSKIIALVSIITGASDQSLYSKQNWSDTITDYVYTTGKKVYQDVQETYLWVGELNLYIFFTEIGELLSPSVIKKFLINLQVPSTTSVLSLININTNFNENLTGFSLSGTQMNSPVLSSSKKISKILYKSENINDTNVVNEFQTEELSNYVRFNRFSNPLIVYDFKFGNYLEILRWTKLYPYLITSYIEVGKNIRKSPWFFSDLFYERMAINYENFTKNFIEKEVEDVVENYTNNSHKSTEDQDEQDVIRGKRQKDIEKAEIKEEKDRENTVQAGIHRWYFMHVKPTDNYMNIFYLFDKNQKFINLRWIALNSLDQKFYKMFGSSSMHQRILSNWRYLKFTREAWRCKLLAVRHQNTLYRRSVNETNILYTIDRNSKDLLPGWAMITPFSARTRYTAVGKTDIGLMGVFIAVNASIVSSANFLVTYRYLSTLSNRKMRDARSFFTEALIAASWMMIAANPMLAIGILMLISDRHWRTSFFDYSGGGDTVLFQHMFWFFGHPEVYVIMLPVFGFTNTMMSFYLRKRISARASLLYSMYTIAFLGFFVWGHHMYMVGLSHTTRMLFSTLTVMISVPAATKLMHWCVTIVNSTFVVELPFLYTFTFVFFFVSGGVSGMCVAHTGMDVLFHDTFYVIGHFHVMFAGAAMLGIFGAFYFYFPAIYGVKYSRVYAYIHYTYYVIGQLLTVIPMMWLGYCGQPRRVLDYPSAFGGWHGLASAGHLLSVAALLSFFIMIYDSVRQAKPAIRNNFGVGRFNTRLNFYLFEINRLSFTQKKNFYNYRWQTLNDSNKSTKRKIDLIGISNLDTTLFSYQLVHTK